VTAWCGRRHSQEMNDVNHERARIPNLDGIRVLAASAVMLVHALAVLQRYGYHDLPDHLTLRGPWVFFVLAGYLAAGSAPPRTASAVRRYARKRLARIWPLHVAVLVPFAAVSVAVFGTDIAVSALVSNLTLTQAWSTAPAWAQSINPPTWALSVDIMFAVVFPVVAVAAAFLHRRHDRRVEFALFACAVAAAVAAGPLDLPVGVRDLPFFLVGAQLRHLTDLGVRIPSCRTVGAALAGVGLVVLNSVPGHDVSWMVGRGLCAVGFGLLVAGAATAPVGVLDRRWARRLGGYSYAYFLLNAPVLGVVGAVVLTSRPPGPVAYGVVAVAAVATWGAAAVARQYVEGPAARLLGPRTRRS
jgi:peptidoglycan/LPS O-acetylase OafA/YrhL